MNSNRWLTLVLGWVWLALNCSAVVYTLAVPVDVVDEGAEFRLDLVVLNPATIATEVTLSAVLVGKLSADASRHWPVELRAAGQQRVWVDGGGFSVHEYVVTLPVGALGRLVLAIAHPVAGNVALEVQAGVAATTPVQAPLHNLRSPQTAETVIQRTFARRFSAHEGVF